MVLGNWPTAMPAFSKMRLVDQLDAMPWYQGNWKFLPPTS